MRELIKKITPEPLKQIYQKLRYFCITGQFYIFHCLPIKKDRIVLCNVWGFGDNAKYVTEELVRRQLPYELIFITNHPEAYDGIPEVRFLKTNSFRAVLALATARIWVESNRKEAYIKKRKGQYYIQLWHGGLPLKKIEGDCAEYLGETYINRARKDSAMTDLYVSNGSFCTKMYRRAFWYHGEILECGTPRNDILFRNHQLIRNDVKRALGIPEDRRIILYAPTYRDKKEGYHYGLDYTSILDAVKHKFGGNWVVVVRLHPLVSMEDINLTEDDKHNPRIINGSHYRDMYELMSASDILITDYSNTMFEFSMMKRPVFLYVADKNNYSKERGFYFTMEELPFQTATTMEGIVKLLKEFDNEQYQERIERFYQKVQLTENGTASEKVVDKIIKVLEQK